MSYKTDINGYVIVKSYQAIPEAADAFTEIQNALDSDYRVVFIGAVGGSYEVSKPVYIPSGKTLILSGTFTVKNGSSSLLTADVVAGANSFEVVDGSIFNVGEWVAITDDAQIALSATLRGSSGKITDITENTITFDSEVSYDLTTVQNAYCGHVQGVMISEDASSLKIIGVSCEINGNRTNQSQIHPVRNSPGVIEDQRAACGLVIYNGSNIELDGVVVKDSLMHNLSITAHNGTNRTTTNITVRNCEGYNGHDKNFLIRDVTGCLVENIIANNATWEDGLIFYVNCVNIVVNGVYAEGNNRAGFYWNSNSNDNLEAHNIVTRNNTRGVYLISKNAIISNVDSNDMLHISSQYNCINNVLNNVHLHDITDDYCLYLFGGIEDITINNLTIDGCSVPAIKSASYLDGLPINILINGGGITNHTGTKLEIAEGSGITFTDFEGLD